MVSLFFFARTLAVAFCTNTVYKRCEHTPVQYHLNVSVIVGQAAGGREAGLTLEGEKVGREGGGRAGD